MKDLVSSRVPTAMLTPTELQPGRPGHAPQAVGQEFPLFEKG